MEAEQDAGEASWLSDDVLQPRLVASHGEVPGEDVLCFAYEPSQQLLALGA